MIVDFCNGVLFRRTDGGVPWCRMQAAEEKMAKTDAIQMEARVIKALPNTMFLVECQLGDAKHEVLATISGRMRQHFVRILPGDTVTVELSPYDLKRGRIIYRNK